MTAARRARRHLPEEGPAVGIKSAIRWARTGFLGASGVFSAYAFDVSTLRVLAHGERRRTRTIVDHMKPARTYLARLVQSWGSPSSTSAQRSSSQAAQTLAADLGFVGVVANAVVSQHAPMPDLTMDICFSALENVDTSKDENGVSTGVSGPGRRRPSSSSSS